MAEYHPKRGEEVSNRECMIIASFGDEYPSSVRIEHKPRDAERAQRAMEARSSGKGSPFLSGVGVDLEIVQDLVREDRGIDLVSVNPDFPGMQHSKDHYLRKIEKLLEHCKQPGAMIWYSGHGERGTGNWCFKDGTISFRDIFDLYMKHFRGSILTVISDCCYSGKWVYACADILDQMGIPPCGHMTKERGMLIKVFASCQPNQKAADPCYSMDAVEVDRSDGYMSFWNHRKLRDKQQTFHADFTKLVCCRDPKDPCPADTFRNWKWTDAVSGKMAEYICLVRCSDKSRPCWYFLLLFKSETDYVERFKAQVVSGNIDVAKWGDVLMTGWGEEPPSDLKEKMKTWTCL